MNLWIVSDVSNESLECVSDWRHLRIQKVTVFISLFYDGPGYTHENLFVVCKYLLLIEGITWNWNFSRRLKSKIKLSSTMLMMIKVLLLVCTTGVDIIMGWLFSVVRGIRWVFKHYLSTLLSIYPLSVWTKAK